MSHLPKEIIGDAYTSRYGWDFLEELVEIDNRMAGHEGELDGGYVIKKHFESIGLSEIEMDSFEIDGWWRGSTELLVNELRFDERHEILALPGTVSGELETEVVDGEFGRAREISDADDRIVLLRTDTPPNHPTAMHRLEKYANAVDKGARGVIFYNQLAGGLPITGEIGWVNRPSPIIGVGASFELGHRLKRYIESGKTKIRLTVDCQNTAATSINISGSIGPDSEEEILVAAHLDSHDISEGARDNGVGCALLVEIGRLLISKEEDLESKVRFVGFGSEEIGLYGAKHFANSSNSDNIKIMVNIDTAGITRTPKVNIYGNYMIESIFRDVLEYLSVSGEVEDNIIPTTDAWEFAKRGIPAVTVGSTAETKGRGWGHTHADTLDKIDIRDLQEQAIVFASFVYLLSQKSTKFPDSVDNHRFRLGSEWETVNEVLK